MTLRTFNNGALLAILIAIIAVKFSNSMVLSSISALIIALSMSYMILRLRYTTKPIDGIPCVPNNSLWGYSRVIFLLLFSSSSAFSSSAFSSSSSSLLLLLLLFIIIVIITLMLTQLLVQIRRW